MYELKKRIYRSGVWSLLGKISNVALSFLLYVILARLLGVEQMGVYYIVLSMVVLLAMLAKLGINNTTVKIVSESYKGNPSRLPVVTRSVLLYSLLTSVAVAILLLSGFYEYLIRRYYSGNIILLGMQCLIIGWLILQVMQDVTVEIYRGLHDIRLASVYAGVFARIMLIAFILFYWSIGGNISVEAVINMTVIALSVSFLISFSGIWRRVPGLAWGELEKASSIYSHALAVFIANGTMMLIAYLDIIMMGSMSTINDAGIYGSAKRMVELVIMPLFIIQGFLPPYITELYGQKKYKDLERVIRVSTTIAFLPALLLFIVYVATYSFLPVLLFGKGFSDAGKYLVILSIGYLLALASGPATILMTMTGHVRYVLVASLVSAVVIVMLMYGLGTAYGPVGIAYGVSAGFLFRSVLMMLGARRQVSVSTYIYLNPMRILPRSIKVNA